MRSVLLPFLFSPAFAAEPRALFNGKDLDGWTFDVITSKVPGRELWTVKEGILVCQGRPPAVMRTKVNEGKGLSTSKGAICLQCEGARIEFRKVTLLPLP